MDTRVQREDEAIAIFHELSPHVQEELISLLKALASDGEEESARRQTNA